MKDVARRKGVAALRPRQGRLVIAAYSLPLFGAFVSNFLTYCAGAYGAAAPGESTDRGSQPSSLGSTQEAMAGDSGRSCVIGTDTLEM